jgi:hypothetical protein
MTRENADDEGVTVRLPDGPPVLTRSASRILLAILVELAEAEDSDGPTEGGGHDC